MELLKTEQEKEAFFDKHTSEYGGYFLVEYENQKTEFIYINRFKGFNPDGTDWFLEYPTQLYTYNYTPEMDEPIIDEEGEQYIPSEGYTIIGDKMYEIVSYQTGPFLEKEIKIQHITNDEREAVEYILENKID